MAPLPVVKRRQQVLLGQYEIASWFRDHASPATARTQLDQLELFCRRVGKGPHAPRRKRELTPPNPSSRRRAAESGVGPSLHLLHVPREARCLPSPDLLEPAVRAREDLRGPAALPAPRDGPGTAARERYPVRAWRRPLRDLGDRGSRDPQAGAGSPVDVSEERRRPGRHLLLAR